MAERRFKSIKSAMRSLSKGKVPTTPDEIKDFLGRITDEKYGLGVKPTTLADVMSYQDDPEMKDFDFFETYYNSQAAEFNRQRSEELYEMLYILDDDEKAALDEMAFKSSEEIAEKINNRFTELQAEKEKDKKQESTETDGKEIEATSKETKE
jgi:hypothetical protein